VSRDKLDISWRMTGNAKMLRVQLQASYDEQDILVQHQHDLLMERDHLYAALLDVANTDGLSGLPNYQAVMRQLDETVACSQHIHGPSAVLFIDVDRFKRVNDTWGHLAGDALLHEVASRLRTALGPDDFVGRYGGEEFLVVLAGMGVPAAIRTAEVVRSAIVAHPCAWQPDFSSSAISIATTVSIGVATYPLHGMSSKALIAAADGAMYQAKAAGRNRVFLAGASSSAPQGMLDEREYMVVQALMATALAHDWEMGMHAQRVAAFASATAHMLQPLEDPSLVRMAALLHDIGKIGVPDTILLKPGLLTEEERQIMQRHPEIGSHILDQIGGVFEHLASIVVAHHERWDGRGYPYGLAKTAIPLPARVLAVADSFDAMTSFRPYRQVPFTVSEAKSEVRRGAGSQFDPCIVEAFLAMLEEREQTKGE
jgi:diguanylate cyclase (GGDEF)-like protein/putative nucleotidyltransferase with HDIG domain